MLRGGRMGHCTAVFTVRVGMTAGVALMLSACASVSLGRAEEGVPMTLGDVTWERQDAEFHVGHIVLETEEELDASSEEPDASSE